MTDIVHDDPRRTHHAARSPARARRVAVSARMCLTCLAGTASVSSIACGKPDPRASTLKVSYYAQDSAFIDAAPLRVSVQSKNQLHNLRGAELAPYHPFLVSGPMPLDSGATLPVTVSMLGLGADTAAHAQITFGPVEPATAYTLGVTVGRRGPATASARCEVRVAVPIRRANGDDAGDSLFVSITGMRDGAAC